MLWNIEDSETDINIPQSNAAKLLWCGGIFNDHITADLGLLLSAKVKEFSKTINTPCPKKNGPLNMSK